MEIVLKDRLYLNPTHISRDIYKILNKELKSYDEELAARPKIIVANKMDLPEAAKNLKRFQKKYKENIFPTSALEKEGLENIIDKIREMLKSC